MTEDDQAFEARAELAGWIEEQRLPRGHSPQRQRELLVDSGWAAPSWSPADYGKGLSSRVSRTIARTLEQAGIPGGGQDLINIPAGTIAAHGDEAVKERFLRSFLLESLSWCLLYSEPGAGSDLASVQTTALRDGDGWVVNGQKVWTTHALNASFGLLLARTDWDAPKHAGISFLLCPMRQEGVKVRPLRQITGGSSFNEVFLTDARIPAHHVVGTVDAGWRVLQTALSYERALMGSRQDSASSIARSTAPDRGQSSSADPLPLSRALGRSADPVIRQEVASLYCLRRVNEFNAARAQVDSSRGSASPLASLGKLSMSRILHSTARLNSYLLGANALLYGESYPDAHANNDASMTAFVNSIGGGTDQIQRTIIGERILGLPREPEVDREVPVSLSSAVEHGRFRPATRPPAARPVGTFPPSGSEAGCMSADGLVDPDQTSKSTCTYAGEGKNPTPDRT